MKCVVDITKGDVCMAVHVTTNIDVHIVAKPGTLLQSVKRKIRRGNKEESTE